VLDDLLARGLSGRSSWLAFLRQLDQACRVALTLHLILYNYAIHKHCQGAPLGFVEYATDYVAEESQAKRERRGIWNGKFVVPAEAINWVALGRGRLQGVA
jgi:hypothetical protein